MNDVSLIDIPVKWLDHICLIDTPGTNAIIRKHEQLTNMFVPRADLVLFVTSAERPLSDSEAEFFHNIKKWGKKVIIVVNKMDILNSEEQKNTVISYVSANASNILGTVNPVPIFGVSARLGLDAKMVYKGSDPALGPGAGRWLESRLGVFEEVNAYFIFMFLRL